MNADAFRQFYEYHFAENRKIWDKYVVPLPYEDFTRESDYSHGSVRDQLVHIMSADNDWFTGLREAEFSPPFGSADHDDREAIRRRWDEIEAGMRAYLAGLRDDMLFSKPFPPGEDENLIVWQVLLHVVNHGTDHRAQVLRLMHDLGIKTGPQDFIFYVYDHP